MTSVEFIEPISHDDGVARATELFRATFGEEPAGVWAAPGRVNLIGEHTDYNAGLCLPIALPHRTFLALKPREDSAVRLVSDVNPTAVAEAELYGLQARGVDGWAAYPTGVPGPCARPDSTRCAVSTPRSSPAYHSAPA